MCWSLRVTAFFCILESICGCALLLRGQRLLLLAMAPLLLQELGQYWLWQSIEADERSSGCSTANAQLTIFQLVVVGFLLPTCGAIAGLCSDSRFQHAASTVREQLTCDVERDQDGDEGQLRRSYQKMVRRSRQDRVILCGMPAFALVITSIGGMLWAWGAHAGWPGASWCSTRGVHGGHQLWPWVRPPLPPPLLQAVDTASNAACEVCACWWLRTLPLHWLHGNAACRWCKSVLSSAVVHLCFYLPFWSLYVSGRAPAYRALPQPLDDNSRG